MYLYQMRTGKQGAVWKQDVLMLQEVKGENRIKNSINGDIGEE